MQVKELSESISEIQSLGDYGENLTVAVEVIEIISLKLFLQNIKNFLPNFKGNFIFYLGRRLNNKMQDEATCLLKSIISPSFKIFSPNKNQFDYQWRNNLIPEITKKWVIFLDSQIMITNEFYKILNAEIYKTNSRFIAIFLTDENNYAFVLGRQLHLYHWISKHYLSRPCYKLQSEYKFLTGGISLIHLDTLKKEGPFDLPLYIGFEETKFAIDLIKKNIKVSFIESKAFIKISSGFELYPKINNLIKNKYFFSSFLGLKSADNSSSVEKHHSTHSGAPDFLISSCKFAEGRDIACNKTLKILIIVDVVNWAFANIGFNLLKFNQSKIKFMVLPLHDLESFHGNNQLVAAMIRDCDIVHLMWRGELTDLFYYRNSMKLIDLSKKYKNIFESKIFSTAIYDHVFMPYDYPDYQFLFAKYIKNNYYTVNKKLFDLYCSIPKIASPRSICSDGVDLNLFKPSFYLNNKRNKVYIGWSGNSAWGSNDHKGLHTIIKPAIERLIIEGYSVQLEIADSNEVWHEQFEMVQYYQSLDIYVCASLSEGTPNTVLEAMACGLVIVSTDVGIVREAFGPLQRNYIIERNIDSLYLKLKFLLDNPDQMELIRNENLLSIQDWSWEKRAEDICDYFLQLAKEHDLL